MEQWLSSQPWDAAPPWIFGAVVVALVVAGLLHFIVGDRCPNCRRFRAGMWSGDEVFGPRNEFRRTKYQCRSCGHWWERIDQKPPGESWSMM